MADDDFSQFEVSGPVRVMSEWVPGEQRTHATQYGPDEQHLVFGASAAVSPDLAQGHELHEPFELYQNGKLVGEYSYDDASYYSPGNPTSNSIERYGLPELEGPHSIKWLGKEAASNFGDYEQGANPFAQFEVGAKPKQSAPTVVDPTGEAAAGTMAGEGPGTHGRSDQLSSYAKPGPYVTSLSKDQEIQFQKWVKDKKVPWQDSPTADYDMRGFWKALISGDPRAKQSLSQFDQHMHFPDIWKTPYHKTFSNESIYSTPDAPHWEGDRLVDKNGNLVADETPKKKDDYGGFNTEVPSAKNKAWNLGQSIKNIWDSALAQSAKMGLGATQAETQQAPLGSDPYEQRIKEIQIDPMLSDQEKQKQTDEVKLLQEEHRAKAVPKAQEAYTAAEKQVQTDKPSQAEQFLGSAVPYVASGVVGLPAGMTGMSAIVAAQQWSSEMYADVLRDSVDKTKKADPSLSDAEVMKKAVKAAQEASKGSSVAGLALSLLHIDVPEAWPIIGRIAAKVGLGAGTMEVANTLAEVQKNMAIKKDVDPKQDLLEGLRNVEFHLTNAVAGGAFGGLHGLGGELGRPSHVPIEDRVPIAEVPDTKEEGPKAEETPTSQPEPVQQELPLQPVTGTDPWLSQIANRWVEPRVEAGEIGPITPGTGTSPQAQMARGLQMGPEEIAQHVSDVMQGKGTGHGPALRAREAQLSQEARNASIAAKQNPDDLQAQAREQETFDALTQFHNGPMKKFKENASEEFRSLQGRIPVDLSTFNGLREQWLRDVGKEPSETVQTKMRKMAQEVRQKVTAEDIAMQKLGTEIERIRRTTNLPKENDIRIRIMERMKDDPCRS